jgi:hypothetical protein
MEKLKKNKKKIITLAVIIIVVSLIASIFIDVSFAGTPLESNTVIDDVEYIMGPEGIKHNVGQFKAIEWPERPHCYLCGDDTYYFETSKYVVRIIADGVDVYNKTTEEAKNIFLGGHVQMSIFVTESEIVFSHWEVEVGNWPWDDEENGTYKYSFETGETEKICDAKLEKLTVINKHILLGKECFWGIPQIIFIF